MWLIKQPGGVAVFPGQNNKFEAEKGTKYNVCGSRGHQSVMPSNSIPVFSQGLSSPFGAHPIPNIQTAMSRSQLPRSAKKSWTKTILVVQLSYASKGKQRKNTLLEYSVITQIVINI